MRRLAVWLLTCTAPELGRAGEKAGRVFLTWKGLTVVEQNWRGYNGEIDIISVGPGGTLVFTEVKTTTGAADRAWERLDAAKEKHLVTTGGDYLRSKGLEQEGNIRYDALIVLGDPRRLAHSGLFFIWERNLF